APGTVPTGTLTALQADGAASPGTVQAIERIVSALLIDYDSWDAVPDRTRQEIERLQREWVDAKAGSWWLRRDIIWSKPNPMPESVTDRPTSAHEYVFLLTKAARYFYDVDAVREPQAQSTIDHVNSRKKHDYQGPKTKDRDGKPQFGHRIELTGRNCRSVWEISTEGFPGSHFATFPRKLVEPCLLAGTSAKGCCGKCGAPWERVVENHQDKLTGSTGNVYTPNKVGWSNVTDRTRKIVTTIGWQPTCSCDADVEPCMVLDPFLGSGTVAEVAIRHGRRFVGIELQEDYRALIEKRLAPAITAAQQGKLFELADL
ncbi:MAG: DNA-methyltransferase, partial [Methyloligellaceae bacterium]